MKITTELALPPPQLEAARRMDLRVAINECLDKLPPKQAGVVRKRFLEGMAAKDIAKEEGLCESHIRLLITHGIKKLRHPVHRKKLMEFG